MLSGELYTQKIFSSLKYIFSLLFSLLPCSVFAVVIGWNQISLYDLLPFIAHLGTQKCTDKWFICQVWKALALLKLSKHTEWKVSVSASSKISNFIFFSVSLDRAWNGVRIWRVLLVSVPTCNRSHIYHNRRVWQIKSTHSCRSIFHGDHQIQWSQLLETQHFTAKMYPFWYYWHLCKANSVCGAITSCKIQF